MRPFEELNEREQIKQRRYEAKALGSAAARGLRESEDGVFWPEHITKDPHFGGKYGELAEKLFLRFIPSVASYDRERVITQSMLHGFYVITAMLEYAPRAYADFGSRSINGQSKHKLGTILRRSVGTPLMFAKMQNRANKTYEMNFGIGIRPNFEDQPFQIAVNETDGLPYFVPSDLSLELTSAEVDARYASGDLKPQQPHRKCPGPIKAIWEQAIKECMADPELFEADFQRVEASQRGALILETS